MTTREQFEAELLKNVTDDDYKKRLLEKDEKGNYVNGASDIGWGFWQACQDLNNAEIEKLSVELARCRDAMPSDLDVVTRDYAFGHPDGVADYIVECVKAMQSDIEALKAERESLLAENVMIREAIEEAIEFGIEKPLHDALSTTPRLVEVGEVKDNGNTHNFHGELQLALCAMPMGTKLYALKEGE